MQVGTNHVRTAPYPRVGSTAEADLTLACLVQQALTDLAGHSTTYAKHYAGRAGVRLAYHVRAGQIAEVSEDGRQAMKAAYLAMQAALVVEPGLDTNAFRRHLCSHGCGPATTSGGPSGA
jgi:hypothetical protein